MMRIARIDPKRPDAKLLRDAAAVLKRGGLVVYPTETAYALGCDANNAKAMRRIYAVKGREKAKPLPLIAGSLTMARRFVKFDYFSLILAKKNWPGPLTLVLGKHALRVSSHPTARGLSAALGRPIVSTSANRSGMSTKYDVLSVINDLGTLPDLILDAGQLKPQPPSTIVKCDGEKCVVLREGAIKL